MKVKKMKFRNAWPRRGLLTSLTGVRENIFFISRINIDYELKINLFSITHFRGSPLMYIEIMDTI